MSIKNNLISNGINSSINLNPWFVTGFADAEGSFSVLIQENIKYKSSWRIKIIFSIGLHKKDELLLKAIQSTLNVGKIYNHGKDSIQFRVESLEELPVIINHFNIYTLKSVKYADFVIFKECFNLIKSKEHLTKEGLKKLVNLKASLNLGISDKLKEVFTDIIPVDRVDTVFLSENLDPNWVAGFISGDGSFNIKTSNSSTSKLGTRIQLRFSICLNIREKQLIEGLNKFFKLNNKCIYYTDNSVALQLVKFSDIKNIIIPFFEKYLIQGIKQLDFNDFKTAANIMEKNEHLTQVGLDKILNIKINMNKGRLISEK